MTFLEELCLKERVSNAKERHNFVYGNEEEGIPGCIKNGISEEIANKIYDKMIDFAKYAFNKSHAAAYAVVAYETAYLKHYYPVEFMAALMTSFIENSSKVSQYIVICKIWELTFYLLILIKEKEIFL